MESRTIKDIHRAKLTLNDIFGGQIRRKHNVLEWKSCPLNVGLSIEFNRVNLEIASCQIQTGQDKWMCLLTPDGRYTVEALRRRIDLNSHQSIILPQISWCKIIHIKVLCFAWRAAQGHIPSATALQHRGMNIDSTHCSSCIGGVECADHILISCLYASYIRDKIFEWCGITKTNFNNVGDLLQFAASWGRCPKKRIKLLCICYGLIWSLWKTKNDRIFRGVATITSRAINNIKSLTYLWLKCRGNGITGDLIDWNFSPFSHM
ncbi:uncharacterized protein LOC111891089 [Lactuca sativa]|uniref:uncharacterized protein LOC111891089 n=1 Tax=Lactuca sativa TaxID=4236 RepID=UPI000CD7EFA8|nr:uncharacterized protein LOC111891089 [Lactuca sativa]